MVAIALLFGRLTAEDYEDSIAADPVWGKRIDDLRARITCVEDPQFTRDYHDPTKRSIPNALTLGFNGTALNGDADAPSTTLPELVVEYPIGHMRRRAEGIPLLEAKFRANLARRFPAEQQQRILDACADQTALEALPVHAFVDLFIPHHTPDHKKTT
jgi:2-methylcitrate dehydratase